MRAISEIQAAEKKIKHALRTSHGSAPLSQVIVQTHLPYHLAFNVTQMLKDRGDIKMESRLGTNGEDFMLSVSR